MNKTSSLLFIPFLTLAGCAGHVAPPSEPIVKTVTVKVPVVEKCDARTKIGPRQVHPDTNEALAAAKNLFDRAKLLMAGREERKSREEVLESAVDACSN